MVHTLKIKLIPIILISFISFTSIIGQWNFSLSTAQKYNDNPFNSPLPVSTLISSLGFGIEKGIGSFGLGYYGNYNIFHEIETRNFYWHQVGLWKSTDSSMFGVYLEQRVNNPDYKYYNYINYNAYFKQRFQIEDINLFANAALSLTDYSDLNDLDNILGNIGIMVNKSFETKTTLIGGLNFNYKNYFGTNLNSGDLTGDSLASSSPSAFTSQFNFYGRIAQSITESTGLAIQYSNQNIIGGTASFIRELDYVYGDESQYFDDPISYEGYTLSAQLTQILPEEIVMRAILSISKKDYPSQGIYIGMETFDEKIIRNDDLTELNISLSKYFYLGAELQNTIMLSLTYELINNSSNSFWYNYKSNQINLNFNFQF